MLQKKYQTSGVVPASIEVNYDNQRTTRNGGAVWDSDKKAWRCTTWVSNPEKYRVVYDDGRVEVVNQKPDTIESEGEEKKPQITSIETIPAYWELENKYIQSDDVPEWEQYKVRDAYYIEVQPPTQTIPLSRQSGPDRLIREAMKSRARIGQLR